MHKLKNLHGSTSGSNTKKCTLQSGEHKIGITCNFTNRKHAKEFEVNTSENEKDRCNMKTENNRNEVILLEPAK